MYNPTSTTTINFVRHGAVDNPTGIYYGRKFDLPLSDEGRRQAAAAGRRLSGRPVAAIFHSPLLRTTQTAAILADQLSLTVVPRPEQKLLEVYTPFDGITMADLEARSWDLYTGSAPPYEQPADILERVFTFFEGIFSRYSGQEIIAVSHGDVIAFTLLWSLSGHYQKGEKVDFRRLGLSDGYPATASISTLTFAGQNGEKPVSITYTNPCPAS